MSFPHPLLFISFPSHSVVSVNLYKPARIADLFSFFSFSIPAGTAVSLSGLTTPSSGTYNVTLDEYLYPILSARASFTAASPVVLFYVADLDPTVPHSLEIVNAGVDGGANDLTADLILLAGGINVTMTGIATTTRWAFVSLPLPPLLLLAAFLTDALCTAHRQVLAIFHMELLRLSLSVSRSVSYLCSLSSSPCLIAGEEGRGGKRASWSTHE